MILCLRSEAYCLGWKDDRNVRLTLNQKIDLNSTWKRLQVCSADS
ncbi:hypothetical protein MUK42_28605, partial [Musa troglodytarum]